MCLLEYENLRFKIVKIFTFKAGKGNYKNKENFLNDFTDIYC